MDGETRNAVRLAKEGSRRKRTVASHEKVLVELIVRGSTRLKTVIKIVSWDERPPVLEKRQIMTEAGKERVGKCKGLNPWEFDELVHRADEIREVFIKHDARYRGPNGQKA